MKKSLLLAIVFIAVSFNLKAQIPNNGFENWTTIGSYMDPLGYLTPNSFATTAFYPVTRSTDHYPATVGNYSLKIENNTSLLPNGDALGIVLQNKSGVLLDGPKPFFPITGHPTSLTGYYKYAPLNGDTMRIQIFLTLNGSYVSYQEFLSTAATGWTSFVLPLPAYTSADSCSIMFSAYSAGGPPPDYVPHGNSVLFIDNLNFDQLIPDPNAPVVLNGNNMPAAGYSKPVYTATPVAGAGNAGANKTWDFSGLTFTFGTTLAVVTPSATPLAGTYPTANFGFCLAGTQYHFFNISATKMDALAVDATTSGGGDNYTPDPKLSLHFPFNFGESYNDTYQNTGGSSETITVSYDGYGTVITPQGTYNNVVRIKESYNSGNDYSWYTLNPLMILMHYSVNDNNLIYVAQNAVNIDENTPENFAFKVFPNPASDYIMLDIDDMRNTEFTLNIFDLMGKLICSVKGAQNQYQLNISDLNNGIYMIEIKSKDRSEKQKLIIQR